MLLRIETCFVTHCRPLHHPITLTRSCIYVPAHNRHTTMHMCARALPAKAIRSTRNIPLHSFAQICTSRDRNGTIVFACEHEHVWV